MKSRIKAQTAVELLQIFWPDFVEVNDLILLPWERATALSDTQREMGHTEIETFLNHTHIIDLFRHEVVWENGHYDHLSSDFEALCEIGKKLAGVWSRKLQADFPNYQFRVYYTQDDDPIVRFHRVRESEPYWLDENDYSAEVEQGRVIVYDTEQRSATTSRRNGE